MRLSTLAILLMVASSFFGGEVSNDAAKGVFDPNSLRVITNINIDEFHNDNFAKAFQKYGESPRVDKGDASEHVGSVTYIGHKGQTYLRFTKTECTDGWEVGLVNSETKPAKIVEDDFTGLGIGNLKLGASAQKVCSLLNGPLADGWKVHTESQEKWDFHKNATAKDGTPYCDHIWVSLGFGASGANKVVVDSGGCDDSACSE